MPRPIDDIELKCLRKVQAEPNGVSFTRHQWRNLPDFDRDAWHRLRSDGFFSVRKVPYSSSWNFRLNDRSITALRTNKNRDPSEKPRYLEEALF